MNVTRGYTSNGLNQYTVAGPLAMTYDAKGNVTASGSDSYSYSSENLMLTGPNGAALVYDPLLRLAQVSNATTVASRFLYDGQSIIGQADGSGTFDRRYVLVPGSDEVLVEYKINAGSKNWKLADERGSVIASTDASGAVLGYQRYDEYGIPSATNSMRYQYTGQVWLNEIGMYYYKARMYSPTLGRFMQTDPIGYGDGMNWYNYVKSDPINRSDPSGNNDCGMESDWRSGDCEGGGKAAVVKELQDKFPHASDSAINSLASTLISGFDAGFTNDALKSTLAGWQPGDITIFGQFSVPEGRVRYTLVATSGFGTKGVEINIYFKGNTSNLNWKQVAKTNALSVVSTGGYVNKWFQDGYALPYYYNSEQLSQMTTGNTARFYDSTRFGGPHTFIALTSLVNTQSGASLFSLMWGYNVPSSGSTTIFPVRRR